MIQRESTIISIKVNNKSTTKEAQICRGEEEILKFLSFLLYIPQYFLPSLLTLPRYPSKLECCPDPKPSFAVSGCL